MLVFGLLLLLLQTAACESTISSNSSSGVEQSCRFNQSDPCYAALGHKLNLLMVNASLYKLKIVKRINNTQEDPCCRVKNDTKSLNECDLYINRPEVRIINGTLIINSVKKEDSGNYKIYLDNNDGIETHLDLQVNVEAPVGSVEVSIICSSNQMRSVSCSSEGDQLLYSWTLNGNPLMDGNSSIQIQDETEGEITCTVENHISRGNKTVSITCPVSVWFVLVWCFQLMTLFGLLGGFHIYINTQVRKETGESNLNMRRFEDQHEHTAEDSAEQQQISSQL